MVYIFKNWSPKGIAQAREESNPIWRKLLRLIPWYSLGCLLFAAISLFVVVDHASAWHPQFNREIYRSWLALTSSISSNSLGFVMEYLIIPIIAFPAVSFAYLILKERHDFWKAVLDSLVVGVFTSVTLISFWGAMLGWNVVKTVYFDHQCLVQKVENLTNSNTLLSKDLDWRKSNLSAGDPVYFNIISMLQAFTAFKFAVHGSPCVIYASAPKETVGLAAEIMQLAAPQSGCAVFGPAVEDDEISHPELFEGMTETAITVHAADTERAADGLFSTLGNEIQLKRSYRLLPHPENKWSPYSPQQHIVWLQFGREVQWNSELVYAYRKRNNLPR